MVEQFYLIHRRDPQGSTAHLAGAVEYTNCISAER